jgi:hypothetical protein
MTMGVRVMTTMSLEVKMVKMAERRKTAKKSLWPEPPLFLTNQKDMAAKTPVSSSEKDM